MRPQTRWIAAAALIVSAAAGARAHAAQTAGPGTSTAASGQPTADAPTPIAPPRVSLPPGPGSPGWLDDVHARLAARARALNSRAGAAGSGTVSAAELRAMIPDGVWAGGERHARAVIDGYHISHVDPVRTHPHRAADARNLVFEPAARNWARGARPMTPTEQVAAHASTAGAGLRGGALTVARSGAKVAGRVALIEGAVAACVEWDTVRRGHKSVQDAGLDWTRSTGAAAGGGLALTGGIGLATAAGFGPPGWLLIAAAGTGVVLYGVNAYERIASTCAAPYNPAGSARPESAELWSAGSTPPGRPPARFRGPEPDAEAIERYTHWRSGSSAPARR